MAAGTRTWRSLTVLCLASAGWAFSFGIGAPLASLWLRDAGCSAKVIGLNTSAYYLGVAVASVFVPWAMRRWGRACVVAGMLADALTTALFPWASGLTAWFLLRVLGGVGTALSLIPMETLVNRNAPPGHRARDFGFYAFSVASGIGLGSVVGLPLYPLHPYLAFGLGGLVTLLATGLCVRLPVESVHADEPAAGRPPSLRANSLSFGTAWAQGFLEGGMLAFLSIYLQGLDYSAAEVGRLLGVLFLGVILCQVPVAWLADRFGRLRLLLTCHALLLVGLLCVPFCTGPVALSLWLFLLGACCSALYPLGLAVLGERVPASGLAQANAWYLASNCAGSLSGPVVIGLAIDLFGRRAQFPAAAAAVVLVVGAWAAGKWGAGRGAGGQTLRAEGSNRSGPGQGRCRMAA